MRISKPTERWFAVPGDPDNAEIKIKHLSPGEVQDIVDEVLVQEIVYSPTKNNDAPIIRQKNDRRRDREKTILASVVDWKSFFNEQNKPMKCTPQNVLKAARGIEGFVEFISECREKLSKDIKSEFEDQKKT